MFPAKIFLLLLMIRIYKSDYSWRNISWKFPITDLAIIENIFIIPEYYADGLRKNILQKSTIVGLIGLEKYSWKFLDLMALGKMIFKISILFSQFPSSLFKKLTKFQIVINHIPFTTAYVLHCSAEGFYKFDWAKKFEIMRGTYQSWGESM